MYIYFHIQSSLRVTTDSQGGHEKVYLQDFRRSPRGDRCVNGRCHFGTYKYLDVQYSFRVTIGRQGEHAKVHLQDVRRSLPRSSFNILKMYFCTSARNAPIATSCGDRCLHGRCLYGTYIYLEVHSSLTVSIDRQGRHHVRLDGRSKPNILQIIFCMMQKIICRMFVEALVPIGALLGDSFMERTYNLLFKVASGRHRPSWRTWGNMQKYICSMLVGANVPISALTGERLDGDRTVHLRDVRTGVKAMIRPLGDRVNPTTMMFSEALVRSVPSRRSTFVANRTHTYCVVTDLRAIRYSMDHWGAHQYDFRRGLVVVSTFTAGRLHGERNAHLLWAPP